MKRVLLFLLLIVVIAVAVGAYLWNKPHKTVEEQEAIAMQAEDIFKAYTTNEQQANTRYLNQVLDVTGVVSEVGKNQDGKTVITLGVSDPLSGVQCTMRENNIKAEVGKTITVKGFCNGYTLVVLLSDCIIK